MAVGADVGGHSKSQRAASATGTCVKRFSGCGAVSSAFVTFPFVLEISTGTSPAFSSNSSRAGGVFAREANTKAVPTLGWPARESPTSR